MGLVGVERLGLQQRRGEGVEPRPLPGEELERVA
jgi:hypothetical protein